MSPARNLSSSHPLPRSPLPPLGPARPLDPTASNCTSFKIPHPVMVADLANLCKAMHFMSACSVNKACAGVLPAGVFLGNATAKIGADPEICRPGQLLVSVCKLDEGMSKMAGEGREC